MVRLLGTMVKLLASVVKLLAQVVQLLVLVLQLFALCVVTVRHVAPLGIQFLALTVLRLEPFV